MRVRYWGLKWLGVPECEYGAYGPVTVRPQVTGEDIYTPRLPVGERGYL